MGRQVAHFFFSSRRRHTRSLCAWSSDVCSSDLQSNLPKSLEFYYFIDPTGAALFWTNATAFVPALNVSLPTSAAAVAGTAVDGTAAINQTNLSVLNQLITGWLPGAALWLVWEMADPT